jgi:subfamily B ATP-binding cassette protein MsbA
LWLNWKLTLVTLAIVPVSVWVFKIAGKRLRYTSREMQKNVGDITHVLEESIGAHKLVKVFDGTALRTGSVSARPSSAPASSP